MGNEVFRRTLERALIDRSEVLRLTISQNGDVSDQLAELALLAPYVETLHLATSQGDVDGVIDVSPFSCLKRLRALIVTRGKIADLSPLTSLENLERIVTHGLNFGSLTPVAKLSKLRTLMIQRANSITDLAPLAGLTELQSLAVQGAQSITDLSSLRDLTGIRNLDVSGTNVGDLSPIENMKALGSLSIAGTAVSDVSVFEDLRSLHTLTASCSELSDISPLKYLTAMHSLNLQACKATDFTALASLRGLQKLYLADTRISELSPLAGLTGLQILDLRNTSVSDLAELRGLSELKTLRLSGAPVVDLRPLEDLKALEALDLRNVGQVVDLSPLMYLPALRTLQVTNGPQLGLPSGLTQSDNAPAIMRHVRDAYRRQLVPLSEAVVQVVGEPAVGKSWLCNRVFREQPNPPQDPGRRESAPRTETHDYEIIHLDAAMIVNGVEVNVRVRDFGGQHVLHGVHELFLTEQCLYLLVVDASRTQSENRIRYWLKFIRHMAGQSPVLIVVTQCDRPKRSLGRLSAPELSKLSGAQVIGIVDGVSTWAHITEKRAWYTDTSAAKGLREEVAMRLAKIPAVAEKVSPVFRMIRDHVVSTLTSKALMPIRAYRAACEQLGVDDPVEQDAYLNWLRHLGFLAYYGLLASDRRRSNASFCRLADGEWSINPTGIGEEEDLPPGAVRLLDVERHAELESWIVNVQWLKWPLYEIIRESERSVHGGVLPRVLIDGLTSAGDARFEAESQQAQCRGGPSFALPAEERDVRSQVVRGLLDLIGLAMKHTGPERYLFPRGLPSKGAPFRLGTESKEAPAVFRWDFLPEAALHRFLVRAMKRGEVRENRVWRYGAVLELVAQGRRVLVTVEGVPEAGEARLTFHDKDLVARELGTALVRTGLVDEVGCPPIAEPAPPKPAAEWRLSGSRQRAWDALDRFLRETADAAQAYPTRRAQFAQMMRIAEYREMLGLQNSDKGYENFEKYIRDAIKSGLPVPGLSSSKGRSAVRHDEV